MVDSRSEATDTGLEDSFFFFLVERVFLLVRTDSIHYTSASRRDALIGVADDCLINSTQVIQEDKNKEGRGHPQKD